jgi:hypothetical protein
MLTCDSCGVRGMRRWETAMPVGHGSEAARLLRWAVDDSDTVRRYRAKVVAVPGSACAWWSGALSGRGHGRSWLGTAGGRDVVVIAHRFGFALEHGVDALLATGGAGPRLRQPDLPTHRCRARAGLQPRTEPARVGCPPGVAGSPLLDRRGARGRARALRDAVQAAGGLFAVIETQGLPPGVQLPLWTSSTPPTEAWLVERIAMFRT